MNDERAPSPPPAPSGGADAPLPTPTTRASRRRLPSLRRFVHHLIAVRVLLTALLLLAVLYTLELTQALIIPLVLAAFIGLGLNPVVAAASRIHIPRAVAALFVMLALGCGIGFGVDMLAQPAMKWLHRAPVVLQHVESKLKPVTKQINAATQATQAAVSGQPTSTRITTSKQSMFTTKDVLRMTPGVLASVLGVALLVFFFLIYGDVLLLRLVEISPTFAKKRVNVMLVRNIQVLVSRYLLTTSLINTTLGALTAGWLWAMGVPDPLLWGGLVALANFIPYVGAICMTLLLLLVGLLNFDDLLHGLLPAAGFVFLSGIEGNFATPLIMGGRMRLSPVAILVWLLIWGWMWGIPGVLMAVPMLTIAKLIAEQLPGWHWFAQMVAR